MSTRPRARSMDIGWWVLCVASHAATTGLIGGGRVDVPLVQARERSGTDPRCRILCSEWQAWFHIRAILSSRLLRIDQ